MNSKSSPAINPSDGKQFAIEQPAINPSADDQPVGAQSAIDKLKCKLESWGIVGAGGAGFPTYKKIDPRAEIIILNCAECEPLIEVDQLLLTRYTREILSTFICLAKILNAKPIVAIKKAYTSTISAVQDVLSNPYDINVTNMHSGIPGNDMHSNDMHSTDTTNISMTDIHLALLEDMYPAGDEILLIYETTGIIIPPGTLPIESGFVVLNTETVYNIHKAEPLTTKWVTITGNVKNPTTIQLPLGTTIEEAIKKAGGVSIPDPAYIAGGLMMGKAASATDKITKTTKAIIVMSRIHNLSGLKPARSHLSRAHSSGAHSSSAHSSGAHSSGVIPAKLLVNRTASACCQCRTCTEMCPRYLLGYPIEPHRIMRALANRNPCESAFKATPYCSLCGLCEIVCPQSLHPRTLIQAFKKPITEMSTKINSKINSEINSEINSKINSKISQQNPQKYITLQAHPARENRRVNINRLKARLGLI